MMDKAHPISCRSDEQPLIGHNTFGRLASVTAAVINGVEQLDPPTTLHTYDPVGNLDTVTLPNDVVEDYDYDDTNRLEKLTAKLGQQVLFQQDYTLLPDDQRDYVIERRMRPPARSASRRSTGNTMP